MTNKKIELEINKIGKLKLRIERLINFSQKKLLDIKKEFDTKVNTIYTLIEQSEEKIRKLRVESLKDKEVLKELDYDLGVDWIHGETTAEVPVNFNKIEEAKDYLDDALGIEFLE